MDSWSDTLPVSDDGTMQADKGFWGGAVVLEYNPNPAIRDHNYWLSTNFASGCGPFFLLYEHINGTRFIPPMTTLKI